MAGTPQADSGAPEAALRAGAAALGIPLTDGQVALLLRFSTLLREGGARLNLTAISDPVEVAQKHLVDSLTVLLALPHGTSTLIDVGTGAGLPGLPLKIGQPALEVTLLEATGKKAAWVEQTAAVLGLRGVGVVAERAEAAAHDPALRGRFDVAVARAVAPLAVLAEYCLPFVRPGGRFIAQKTAAGADAELPAAERAFALLGAKLREVRPVDHPPLPNRVLVVVEQQVAAPLQYPRRPGVPAKRPLA